MRTLYVLGLFSAIRALGLVLLAGALATGIVSVIEGDERWHGSLITALLAAVLRAGAHWATQAFAAREVLAVKERSRQELAEALVTGGVGSVGAMTALATQGLDELDKYYGTVLPAMTSAAVIPLAVGARILFADWISALIVVVTVPLIPIFMALIGMETQSKVTAASAALARLSDNLVELARGLPVLVGLGRVGEQTAALERISDDYRVRTMQTLRIAFMSSLALELISTISVAVVAVFIGTRLVAGEMPLEIGLLALILAPECFAPFRDLGAAFHAAQDGVVALDKARGVIDAPRPVSSFESVVERTSPITVTGLSVRYAGRTVAAVDRLGFVVPRGQITAICGASGSGKSTVLAVLAGRLRTGTADAVVEGNIAGINIDSVAWVPQHPHTVEDTVRAELRLYSGAEHLAEPGEYSAYGEYGTPARAAGSRHPADERIDEILRTLGLTHTADVDPAQLSPGELRRVAFARALLRVDAGAELLLLDEPTAHLDAESSGILEKAIDALRGEVTVIVASHEATVTALATHRIELDDGRSRSASAHSHVPSAASGSANQSNAHPAVTASPEAHAGAAGAFDAAHTLPSVGGQPGSLRLLLDILRPAGGRFLLAALFGTAAAAFAVALTVVSAWLIVRASTQPPIMLLMVAIVGVRFFGIGRSVLHYVERLRTHDAIFASVTRLRMRIWRALAEQGTSSRKLLRGGTALDFLVVTADQVRDLAPRVLLPPIVGAACSLGGILTVALLYPAAVPLLAGCVVLCTIGAPAVALWGDRHASRGQQLIRSEVTRRFAALLAAADDLQTNGVARAVLRGLRALDRRAGAAARRSAWALGLGGAVVVGACCATAGLMLGIGAPGIASGTLPIEVVAVLVLLPLALLDPLLGVVDAVQQWPALAQAVRRLAPFTPASTPVGPVAGGGHGGRTATARGETAGGGPDRGEPAEAIVGRVNAIALERVAARWPDATAPVFTEATAAVSAGGWLAVTGPSGSGKSTLLTLLLGYLRPDAGTYLVGNHDSKNVSTEALRRHIAWCPQEGHLFDSTLRANLLLARSKADAPDDAEMLGTLARVGLGGFVAGLPDGLSTRIGSEGAQLSGGQRQRVAVARTLLARSEVVLLDEPTAHLDGQAASELMADLRSALSDRVAVLVTHHVDDLRDDDLLLRLGAVTARQR